MGEDRRDPDRELLRDLYDKLGGVEEQLRDADVTADRVLRNRHDIDRIMGRFDDLIERIHKKVDHLADRVSKIEGGQQRRAVNGGSTLRTVATWVAIILTALGLLVGSFWKIIELVREP